eukprot:2776701-Lingulodinium_polyedra.AAC.1
MSEQARGAAHANHAEHKPQAERADANPRCHSARAATTQHAYTDERLGASSGPREHPTEQTSNMFLDTCTCKAGRPVALGLTNTQRHAMCQQAQAFSCHARDVNATAGTSEIIDQKDHQCNEHWKHNLGA